MKVQTLTASITALALVLVPSLGVSQGGQELQHTTAVSDMARPVGSSFARSLVRPDDGASGEDLLSAPARVAFDGVPLVEALRRLESTSGISIAYSPSLLPTEKRVTCECDRATVSEVLSTILRGTASEFVVAADQVVIRPVRNPEVRPVSTEVNANWSLAANETGVEGTLTPPPSREFQGTVTGQVIDRASGNPLASAQVYIATLDIGVLTQGNGRYLLQEVPVGEHTIAVERIGYRTQTQTVTVSEGQTVVQNFDLAQAAVSLDEIVVTGTAGAARQREVGNSISQLDVAQMVEAPSASVGEMLQGRIAGGSITVGAGTSGSAADIRLRGNVSMSLSNQPLVYIDGVRSKSEPYQASTGADDPMGPLRDLNPDDIERIEVVKGPAATTMYGTEAAAGVIQIFTKSGGGGDATWSAGISQGFSYLRDGILGTDVAPNMYLDPVLRKGHRQNYELSVRGGQQDGTTYYLSSFLTDNLGHVETDSEGRFGLRGNVGVQATENLRIQFSNSLTNTALTHPRFGNSISGIMMTAARGNQSYMGSRAPEVLRTLLTEENETEIARYVSGVTATYTPGAFTHRLTVGYDYSSFDIQRSQPFCWRCPMGFSGDRGGIQRTTQQNTIQSVDYTGNYDFSLSSDLSNTFSFGFQAVENTEESVSASGDNFPGPGEWTVSSAEIRAGNQSKLRTITGGFFVQDRIGWQDRWFLTAGLRVDGNSAFGQDLGLEMYPKVSGSYIISDETFWPELFDETKIRAAFGLAGRAPGAFDAVRTWNPVGFGREQAAFQPGNLGNAELGPERTQELEAGFDASLLDQRLGVDLTYYRQVTNDALIPVRRSSTLGGWDAQLENVGEILNSGWEIMVDADVLDRRSFLWNVGLGVSTNRSEVVSLGGQPPFNIPNQATGSYGWIIEGQPAPVFRSQRIMNYWEKADPIISDAEIYGPAYPTHIFNLSTAVSLPGGIRLSARGEYKGGHYLSNYWEAGALARGVENPKCYDAYRKIDSSWEPGPMGGNLKPEGTSPDLYAWERAQCFGMSSFDLTNTPVDHFELRQITARFPLHTLVPATTNWAESTFLTVSAQNVWFVRNTDTVWLGHPEQNENFSGTHDLVKNIAETMPPSSYFTVSLRVGF